MVLGREDVARHPAHVGAELLERLDEHARLDGHVQRAGDAHAREGLRRAELLARGHEAGHLELGEVVLLAAKVGEGHVGDLVVARGLDILGGRREVVELVDAGEHLALEQLERGAAAGRDEGDLVLHVPLGRGGRRVAAADDALASVRLELGHGLEHGLVRVRG